MKKQYTPIENAFYWIVTSALCATAIGAMMLLYATIEYIFS